jgi:hypothetical protein
MKNSLKSLFTVFIILFLCILGACAKKELKYYSDYIWKPDTEEGRRLKLLYQEELFNIYKQLSGFNFPVQKNGIGFTISEKCQTEGCMYEELIRFWLFIACPLDVSVSANTYKTFENRAEYAIEKRLPDILLPLKKIDFNKIFSDKRFDGIMLSFTWQVKEFPKELIGRSNYETARVYISKDIYTKYINKEIDINELLNNSEIYLKLGPNKSKKINI